MPSKHLHKILSLSIAFLLICTVGCGIKLGEKNKTDTVAQIKGADCLKSATASFKLFVNGDASDDQVSEALLCIQSVLQTFKDNVRGQDKHAFTPEEIGNFLSREYLKDSDPLDPMLLIEVAKLKTALLGGDPTEITKDEIDGLTSLVARYKPDIVKLNPHVKVLVSKWNAQAETNSVAKEQKFIEAKNATLGFLNHIAQDLSAGKRPYELSDLLGLVTQVARFAKVDPSTLKTISDAAPLVLKFKLNLIGGTTALNGDEWLGFNQTIGQLFFQSLRLKYFCNDLLPGQMVEKLNVYKLVAYDVTQLLQNLLSQKPSHLLQNSEIEELVTAAVPLVPDLKINAELIHQLGQIKVVLAGQYAGAVDASLAWSDADFAKLHDKVFNLFKSAIVLVENFKYLKVDAEAYRKKSLKYEDFNNAETLILAAVKELGLQFEAPYDLQVLKATVLNLSQTVLKDTLKLPENIDKIFNLAQSAKYALTGDNGSGLSVANIQLLLNVGGRVFAHYVEYSNFVSVFELKETEFISNFDRLFAKVKPTLVMELTLKASHSISTDELTQLVLTAQTQDFISTQLQKKSLDKLLNILWGNILNKPEDRLANQMPKALSGTALAQLATEVQLWIENQKAIADIFSKKPEYSKEELLRELNSRLSATKNPAAQLGLSELSKALSAPGYMNFNEHNYLKILSATNNQYHQSDMINSNISRLGARVLIRSFAQDIDRVHNLVGITQEEAQYAFDQVKYVTFDLNLIDPVTSDGFIASRFKEANLFLSVGNGDNFASFTEIHHLVLHIMSGLARADAFTKVAKEKCVKVQAQALAQILFDETCLIDLAYEETAAFEDLPKFFDMRQTYTEEQNKTYYLALLKAAGYVPNDEKTVRSADAGLFPHVIQYVEMLYSTHDTSGDGVLDKPEAKATFPVFDNLIALLTQPYADKITAADRVGVFIYLLKNGKPPTGLAAKFKFFAFAKDHDCAPGVECEKGWDIASTRLDVGTIFNYIADATKPTPVVPPPVVQPPAQPISGDPSVPVSGDPTVAQP
jgi:hypothetical protein